MIIQLRLVGEGPGVFLERISGRDQEEVNFRSGGVIFGSKEEAECRL